jgi:6-phosphogluconolactonase
MKLALVVTVFLSCALSTKPIQAQNMSEVYNLIVGTYTSGISNGIYVYSFNTETGDFNYKSEIGGIKNPSFLAVTQDRRNVYAVSETGEGKGSVSAFSFDPQSGNLDYINQAPSGGDGPCYVAVDDGKQFVFVGNYGGGSLSAIPINSNGSLSQDIQVIQHQGSSIHKNQNKPHVHATVLSPDNKYLFVPDLGTDKINIYKVDASRSEPLIPAIQGFAKVEQGGGPRHFAFHPNEKYAYAILELNGKITAFKYNDGRLEPIQTVVAIEDGFSGNPSAADIHLSPDGRFLYGSLRADINEIVIYSVDSNGRLRYVGRQSTLGEHPRNFAIDPTGNYLLVGNGRSDEVVIFKRDQDTGLLAPTGKKISVGSPVCLKFVAIN